MHRRTKAAKRSKRRAAEAPAGICGEALNPVSPVLDDDLFVALLDDTPVSPASDDFDLVTQPTPIQAHHFRRGHLALRILFLCEGTTVPASRFRVGQFLEHWRAAGIDCEVRYGYGDRYNSLVGTRVAAPYKLLSRLKRIPYAADADEFDLVFVQRPALPQTAVPERLLNWLNPNTVFDFDDSLVHGPTQQVEPNRVRSFKAIINSCRHIIAGNRYLARTADAPQKTTIIPTVIDTHAYVPAPQRRDTKVVGWMGTAGNFCMLDFLVEPLRALHERRPDITIRLVSNADYEPLKGLARVEQIRWSKERELELLQSFDVGLMPLEDADVSRGKCAFKMIMYMAVGAPVVVSAVEANVDVMGDIDAGRVMPTFNDWDIAIEELIDDPDLRARQGAAGRARIESHYSVDSVIPKYLKLFERLVV